MAESGRAKRTVEGLLQCGQDMPCRRCLVVLILEVVPSFPRNRPRADREEGCDATLHPLEGIVALLRLGGRAVRVPRRGGSVDSKAPAMRVTASCQLCGVRGFTSRFRRS